MRHSLRSKNRFKPANNPSCRTWWGTGNLRVRDMGGWGGKHILGVVGALEGKYDKRFVKWCVERDLLFIRTVDLFWAFENYRNGFYQHVSIPELRKRWERDINLIQSLQVQIGYRHGHPQFRPLSQAKKEEFRKRWGLGPWKSYHRRNRKYFLSELDRYERVLKFWRECGQQGRRSFLRCARHSNRQADAHPDYLVALRDSRDRVVDFGFVEVKGPREWLHPSQRQFFPELVRCASQKVWLARFPMRGSSINFGSFTATGEVRPRSTL